MQKYPKRKKKEKKTHNFKTKKDFTRDKITLLY